STQKMPRPTSRDAPKFDSDEPENLQHFLGQMEDLFSDYSITDNDKKKKKLVRYTDAHTEEEWQALEEYDNGTFAEFKEVVLKNYPEVADTETGTWERLMRISRKFSNLGANERKSYLKFKHRFLTEAKKLQKPPALVMNHELEDMHTLDEVVAEADDIALNSSTSYLLSATSGSISSTRATSGSGIKAEFEEVKQQVATLLDHIDVSEKQAKESGPSNHCWYDWKPGHFIRDCQNVQKHIAEGLLKLIDRKFMMADGTPIPHEPVHLCPMDCMLATLSKRQEQMFWEDVSGPAGVFNISLPENASLYVNKPRDARDEVIDKL
ncbi:hypothetical protein ARMSODRAFT_838836, partial [Armillaria solidipes]